MTSSFHLLAVLLWIVSFWAPAKTAITTTKPATTIATTAATPPTREENEEFIPWLNERRLTWDDFLCEPKRNTDVVASTSTSLGIAYQLKNNQLTYQLTCNFSKVRSWGLIKTPYILAHEQAHFDITEIYARRLHQALQAYTVNPKTLQQDINRIYENVVKSKEALQRMYDGQTDHSRHKARQQEWLERIDNLLAETEPFANYP